MHSLYQSKHKMVSPPHAVSGRGQVSKRVRKLNTAPHTIESEDPKRLREIRIDSKPDYAFVSCNGKSFKSVRTVFTTACHHANLSGVSPHVLRHTFAARLREQGVSDGTFQTLGRWKEPKMVRRYAHVNNEMMKKAPEQIAENFPVMITTPQESETHKYLCARSSVG
jgi:integrase